MKWIEDKLAETVMGRLGLSYRVAVVPADKIDRKLSRANTARLERLDQQHAESISMSILRGDPIPRIVVRAVGNNGRAGGYVIAGGNHRDEACVITEVRNYEAYIVTCNDAEFLNLCRLLNSVVGKGSPKSLLVRHAAEAVMNQTMSVAAAATEYLVHRNSITQYIQLQRAQLKLAARRKETTSFSDKVLMTLANVQADAVLDAAIDLASLPGIAQTDAYKTIRDSIKQTTEQSQLAYIADAKAQHLAIHNGAPVVSPKRQQFLRISGSLSTFFKKYKAKSLSDLDLSQEECLEVRKRCQELATILRCL